MQTTLTSMGQMTLPKTAREALGLKAGQRFRVEITADGGLLLRPIKLDPLAIAKVLGPPPHPVQPKDAEAIDQAIAEAVAADWERIASGRDDNDRA